MSDGNLFANLPRKLKDEDFQTLFAAAGLRIERVVSTGQVSADWYDAPQGEWVVVLAGSAVLLFEDEAAPRELSAGDYLYIAPHPRHRVTRTAADPPTVWLAVHFDGGAPR